MTNLCLAGIRLGREEFFEGFDPAWGVDIISQPLLLIRLNLEEIESDAFPFDPPNDGHVDLYHVVPVRELKFQCNKISHAKLVFAFEPAAGPGQVFHTANVRGAFSKKGALCIHFYS